MKILVWEDPANVVGHGGSLRTIILNMCPHLADEDVIVCYAGETNPAFPSWTASFTDAGYATVASYAAAEGFAIVNRSYTSSSRMLDFEDAGVPIVHACTGEVGNGPGWCCFVGRDYFDLSTTSAASNALDFKIQYDGTLSAGTATVTGHLANLLYNHSTWNFSDARQALRQTASDYDTSWTNAKGYGYIDYVAANALADVALVIPTPGDLRVTVNNVLPAVYASWSNLPASVATYTATKLVLFAALPDNSTSIASGTLLYEGPLLDYTWDSSSVVPPTVGTHFLAVYAVDDQAGTSRLETYGPLSLETVLVESRNWFVDNELVAAVQDGLSWETAYTSYEAVKAVSAVQDSIYVKATDTPYFMSTAMATAAFTYGDATGSGTERGKKRAVVLSAATGLMSVASLVPATEYPSLYNFAGASSVLLAGLHDGKKLVRLLTKATSVEDCLATPGSWLYDGVTHKNFLNPAGLGPQYFVVCSDGGFYARSNGGIMVGIDFMFHFPGASYTDLASPVLWEDVTVSYCRSGPYAYANSSPHGITLRRVTSRQVGGSSGSKAFDFTSRATTPGARIRAEYCLAENCGVSDTQDGLGSSPVSGFTVAHNELAVYAHYGVELVNSTARNCSGDRFKQTGINGKLFVENCHGTGVINYGSADFNQAVSTATVTCVNNRAGSIIPYAGTWEANKGTGAAENNEVELAASAVAGIHDQATPALDIHGKSVYTLPDVGAVQISGPLYFHGSAPAGGNGTMSRPFNALTDYALTGLRAGAELMFAGALGVLDLSGCADTGSKSVTPWPNKTGSLAGFIGGVNDTFLFSSRQGADRGMFKSIWRKKTMGDDGLWRSVVNEAVDFTALPVAAVNSGRVMRCNPLVAGQPYFWVCSDGQFWRPFNGSVVLYTQADDIVFTTAAGEQIGITIPIPAGMLADNRSALRCWWGMQHEGGATDTVTTRMRFGLNNDITDTALFQLALVTTGLSGGVQNQASRVSPTSIRKIGAAGVASAVSLSVASAIGRQAAITIGDTNNPTVTNYVNVTCQLTAGGSTEYGIINGYTLKWMG